MKARTLNRLTATAATVVFVVLSVILAGLSARPTTDPLHRRPSTFFTDPSGARALLLVMKRFVPVAEIWRRPFNLLPLPGQSEAASTLIVAGPRLPVSKREAEYLKDWLSAGGQLILFTGSGWRTRQHPVSGDESAEKNGTFPDDAPEQPGDSLLSAYAPGLRWTKPGKFKIEQASGASVPASGVRLRWQRSFAQTGGLDVVAAAGSEVLAVAIPLGQGRIIAVADPTMVSNGSLRRSDNAVWLVELTASWGTGSVFFDEYHHGFGHKRSIGELTRAFLMTPWGWCLSQIALAGLLYIFAYRRRFGRISEPPGTSRASPLELIEARAGIFQAAAARGSAARLIVQNLCQALTKSHGKSGDASDLSRELEALANTRYVKAHAAALQAIAAKLRSASLTDMDLLAIGQTAGEILKGQRL
jgi:hypothetical protein